VRPERKNLSLQRMEVHDILIIPKSQPGAWTYRVSERKGEPLMPRNPVLYKPWLDEPDDPHPLSKPMFPRAHLKTTLQEAVCHSI
jgi:hypothetical protein